MSTARPTLAAEHREITGKKVARLRSEGRLPAVVYGHAQGSRSLSLDTHQFEQLRRRVGPNVLIDLHVDGAKSAEPVLIHGVQVHPVTRRPLHVDLFLVTMTEEITVEVPVVTTGESVAVREHGGTLFHVLESVKVRALPDRLPQSLEISVEPLVDFDASLHVRDLVAPAGVTVLTDGDEMLARVLPPRVEAVEAAPEVAEAAEGAPAAEPSGEEAGSSSSGEA